MIRYYKISSKALEPTPDLGVPNQNQSAITQANIIFMGLKAADIYLPIRNVLKKSISECYRHDVTNNISC